MMIFNNQNNKLKNKNLYIIICVLFILVILLNNRDYIENNINKDKEDKVIETFNNNNNNKNTKIQKLEEKVKELNKDNKDIINKYNKIIKEEQKKASKQYNLARKHLKKQYANLVGCEEQDPIKKLQEQQQIVNEKASKDRELTDKEKINEMNKVANDYLEYQKNKGPNINLLNVGKDIEDGIYTLIDNFDSNKNKFTDIFNGKFKSDNNIEGFVNKTKIKSNNNKTNNKKRMNKGTNKKINKQINKKINKRINNNNILKEGFVVSEEDVIEAENIETKELKEKFYLGNNTNKKKEENGKVEKKEDGDSELDEDLLSYFTYVFENIYSLFKKYFNLYINKNNLFNLGSISKDSNTLIGGGILFIVISMGLYFIDISS